MLRNLAVGEKSAGKEPIQKLWRWCRWEMRAVWGQVSSNGSDEYFFFWMRKIKLKFSTQDHKVKSWWNRMQSQVYQTVLFPLQHPWKPKFYHTGIRLYEQRPSILVSLSCYSKASQIRCPINNRNSFFTGLGLEIWDQGAITMRF